MTVMHDAIHQTMMRCLDQGAERERKRIWMIINLDMMIPMEVKGRLRDLILGVDSEEPIFKNRTI